MSSSTSTMGVSRVDLRRRRLNHWARLWHSPAPIKMTPTQVSRTGSVFLGPYFFTSTLDGSPPKPNVMTLVRRGWRLTSGILTQ